MKKPVKMMNLFKPGLAVGLCFLAASLTPTMIPKTAVQFGLLAGISMSAGYFLASFFRLVYSFLEFPRITNEPILKTLNYSYGILGIAALAWGLVIHRPGQNSIRTLMGMNPVDTSHEAVLLIVAASIFLILLLIARLFRMATLSVNDRVFGALPPRAALTGSFILVAAFSWYLSNGVLLRWSLNTMDDLLAQMDALIDPELPAPQSSLRSGSSTSLIPWDTMGAQGRTFLAAGWSENHIADFLEDSETYEPIRIYAGLNSAETAEARALLVLEEMKRTKAFERELVVVVTPTGTGWIDEAAVGPIEVMFGGDTAIVGMQYSYLMSPLALIFEPDVAAVSARALVEVVRNHWSELPSETRPKLFLHGLSLGSYGSEQALSLVDWVENPPSGALWSGPTFGNPIWNHLTKTRNPASPVWSPTIGKGKTVRFFTQSGEHGGRNSQWGDTRIAYLQYPSDPITFFETKLAVRPSPWLKQPRAPDVSERVQWYPLVTMLQIAIDMLAASNVPAGFGHLIAAEHYIDTWLVLAEPKGLSGARVEQLKAAFQ